MKRIEDAPKELQDMFAIVWEQVACSFGIRNFQSEIAHAFLKGFDTAMATGGLPQKPKRTISRIMNIDGQVYVTSTDGKAFVLQGRPEQWRSLPDLPQD